MPFAIRRVGSQWCVYTRGTNKKHGCHPSKEQAERQLRALYANVPEARKFAEDDNIDIENSDIDIDTLAESFVTGIVIYLEDALTELHQEAARITPPETSDPNRVAAAYSTPIQQAGNTLVGRLTGTFGRIGGAVSSSPLEPDWARLESIKLITLIDDSTKDAIREIVKRSFREKRSYQQTAREIRDMIGLDMPRAMALYNYRKYLEGAGKTPGQVESLVAKRFGTLLRQRSLTIARTATIEVGNAALQKSWEQVAKLRDLQDETEPYKQWSVNYDERLCPICAPMHHKYVRLSGSFTLPNGLSKVHPPAHPRCRCAIHLLIKSPEK